VLSVFQNFTGNLKNMKKLLFFLLLFGAIQAKAQVIKGSIDMKDSTINRSIALEVPAGTPKVKYLVKVYLPMGEVTVKLTDSNGKKVGGFTLSTKNSDGSNSPSKGELGGDETPKVFGTWKFNITAEHASGTFDYQIEVVKP
jgi:hypothetical protein